MALDDIVQQFLNSQQPTQSPVAQRMATAMPPSLTQDAGSAQAPTPQAQPQPQRMAAPPPKVTAQSQQPKPPDDLKINVSGGVKSYLPYIVPLLGGVVSAMSPTGARGVHGAATALSALGAFQNRDATQAMKLAQLYQGMNKQQETAGYHQARLAQEDRRIDAAAEKDTNPKMDTGTYTSGLALGFPRDPKQWTTEQVKSAQERAKIQLPEQRQQDVRVFNIANPLPSKGGGGGGGGGVWLNDDGTPKMDTEGNPIHTGTKSNKPWPKSGELSDKDMKQDAKSYADREQTSLALSDPVAYRKLTPDQKHKIWTDNYSTQIGFLNQANPKKSGTAAGPPPSATPSAANDPLGIR